MSKKILPVLLLLISISLPAQELSEFEAVIKGSERKIVSFNKVILQGNGNIFLMNGSKHRLKLEGENENNITVINNGEHLIIRPADEDADKILNIYLQAPDIEQVVIQGDGSVNTKEKFEAKDLDIIVNGKAEISLMTHTENLNCIIESGNIKLDGVSPSASLKINKDGNINAPDFDVTNCEVKIKGAGNCLINAENLDLDVSDKVIMKYSEK